MEKHLGMHIYMYEQTDPNANIQTRMHAYNMEKHLGMLIYMCEQTDPDANIHSYKQTVRHIQTYTYKHTNIH